jgi:hypothetical protein
MSSQNRSEYVEEILSCIRGLAYRDLRITQIFEIIAEGEDIFYMENDRLLSKLQAFEKKLDKK